MNKFASLIAVAGLAVASGSASAWWGPWDQHGYRTYDGWSNGAGDVVGDTDANMNFSGRGAGRGYGRGYGYDRYYGGYAPYYGHGPYGYGVPPRFRAPVSETATKDLEKVPGDVLAAQRKAATEHFKQLEEQHQAALKQAQEQRQAMQKSYEEMMKSRQAQWENRYASPAPAPFVAR